MKTDSQAAGFDPGRMARIDDHLRRAYITPGKIAGCQIIVHRRGQLAHSRSLGDADRERATPVIDDTVWRLYSMTKPITGVALLTLYERGLVALSDPVHRFLPEFAEMKVKERGEDGTRRLVEATRPITVRDALTHMTGIGFGRAGGFGSIARRPPGMRFGEGATLETMFKQLAEEPLRFQPGTHWLYSYSTDLCARLVEVISGEPFDEYLHNTIFAPLRMRRTGFFVRDASRFAALYGRDDEKNLILVDDPLTSASLEQPTLLSGGGGLHGTSEDYLRFCQMLLNGGELDGVRILGPRTVALMTSNHLPGGGDLREFALPGGYGEVGFDGMGFGLTVAVNKGPVGTQSLGSAGEYMWGGAASTLFWIDPAEELIVIFMTQLLPSGTFNLRGQLKSLVYSAIVE